MVQSPIVRGIFVERGTRQFKNIEDQGFVYDAKTNRFNLPDDRKTIRMNDIKAPTEAKRFSNLYKQLNGEIGYVRMANGPIIPMRTNTYTAFMAAYMVAAGIMEEGSYQHDQVYEFIRGLSQEAKEEDLPEDLFGEEEWVERPPIDDMIVYIPATVHNRRTMLAAASADGQCLRAALKESMGKDPGELPTHVNDEDISQVAKELNIGIKLRGPFSRSVIGSYNTNPVKIDTKTTRLPTHKLIYQFNHLVADKDPLGMFSKDIKGLILGFLPTLTYQDSKSTKDVAPPPWVQMNYRTKFYTNRALFDRTMLRHIKEIETRVDPSFKRFISRAGSVSQVHQMVSSVGPDIWNVVPNAKSRRDAVKKYFVHSYGVPRDTEHAWVRSSQDLVNPALSIQVNGYSNLPTYDQKRAYANYANAPNYSGFPNVAGIPTLSRYSPKIFTSPVEGVCWVDIDLSALGIPNPGDDIQIMSAVRPRDSKVPTVLMLFMATGITIPKGWVALPQLRVAREMLGASFERVVRPTVFYGHLRSKKDPFAAVKKVFKNKGDFNSLIGTLHSRKGEDSVFATSLDEGARLANLGWKYKASRSVPADDTLSLHMYTREKKKVPDAKYILLASYVHAYQKVTLYHSIKKVLPVSKGWNPARSIKRIQTDSFSVYGLVNTQKDQVLDVLGSGWRREQDKHTVIEKVNFRRVRQNVVDWSSKDLPEFEPPPASVTVLLGPPGSGKTHSIGKMFGNENILRTSTMHITALNLKDGKTTQSVIARADRSATRGKVFAGYDRLVIDEFTLLNKNDIIKLRKQCIPLVLCGDFLQLCNMENPITLADLHEMGAEITFLEKIWRTKDPETLRMYTGLRALLKKAVDGLDAWEKKRGQKATATLKARWAKKTSSVMADFLRPIIGESKMRFPKLGERAHLATSRNDKLARVNYSYAEHCAAQYERDTGKKSPTVRFGIVGSTKTHFTGKLTPGMLLIATRTPRGSHPLIRNQEIFTYVGGGRVRSYATGRTVKAWDPDAGQEPVGFLPGFAITYHKVQGQTFDFPLLLDTENIFDPCMLYVGVTRVTDKKYASLLERSGGFHPPSPLLLVA